MPTCRMWSIDLLDVEIIEENKLVRYHRRRLVFVVTVWGMPYFHLLPLLINKQYVEGEMSRVVLFVYVFSFNFALTFLL